MLASGRDFAQLQQNLRQQRSSIASADTDAQADHFKQRRIKTLPDEAVQNRLLQALAKLRLLYIQACRTMALTFLTSVQLAERARSRQSSWLCSAYAPASR